MRLTAQRTTGAVIAATTSPTTAQTFSPAVVVGGLVVGVAAVASSAILTRVAIDNGSNPLAIAFWRSLAGAAVLAPAALRDRRRNGPMSATRAKQVAGAGAFLGLHFGLWLSSLELTTVASSVTLVTMSPIFVALGARKWLGEHVARRTWWGMALTIVGALVVGFADGAAIDLGPRALLGDALAFGGALGVAGYLLLGRVARQSVSISRYATGAYAVSAAVLLPTALLLDKPLTGWGSGGWWAIAAIIVGPQLLGHTVFNTLLSSVTPTTVSIVVLSEPILASMLAWFVLSELPAPLFWAGAPLVLIGVAIATTGRRRAGAAQGEQPLRSESVGTG